MDKVYGWVIALSLVAISAQLFSLRTDIFMIGMHFRGLEKYVLTGCSV